MKFRVRIIIVLFFPAVFARAQNFKTLYDVSTGDSVTGKSAIIYGNFIQRLGFSSGGFQQDIRLINTDTKEIVSFCVKPTFKSTKENIFCYKIEPGTYAILHYAWVKSKWYGGKFFIEPIYKGIDATDESGSKINAGKVMQEELIQFKFSIPENALYYLGTWHFDTGLVSFTDDKTQFDLKIERYYQKLHFEEAATVLPMEYR